MYCKYLSKALNGKLKCKISKLIININDCGKCLKFNPRVNKAMKNKSDKLKVKENNRKSILTDDLTKCYICGKAKQDIHEIFGGSNRQTSIKWDCTIPICRLCHTEWDSNKEMRQAYQDECRNKFVELYSYDLFMQEFKKSYKGDD